MEERNILHLYDRHPHIVTLKAFHKDIKRMYLVPKLLRGGELHDRDHKDEILLKGKLLKLFILLAV